MTLTPGGNISVPDQTLMVRIHSGSPVDVSAFRLYASGKVNGDADMVFMVKPLMMIVLLFMQQQVIARRLRLT